MAWQTLEYRIASVSPMIVHNGQLADPLNKWVKAMKLIHAKRKKTDADLLELARLEFLGSLYMDEHGPILPDFMIEATMLNAAKKTKEGPLAKSGLFCTEHAPLIYDGPRSATELWNDDRFHFSSMVRVGQSKVSRMRPIFPSWGAIIKLSYEDGIISEGRINEWVVTGGLQVGLGDWRPRYGRYTLAS